MTIFLVTKGEYDHYEVVGAFSTREKAGAYLNEQGLDELRSANPKAMPVTDGGTWLHDYDKWDHYQIEDVDVDNLPPIEWRCWPNKTGSNRDVTHFMGTERARQEDEQGDSN